MRNSNRLVVSIILLCFAFCYQSAGQTNTPNSATSPASATAKKLPGVYTVVPTIYQRVYSPRGPITDSGLINANALPENIQISTGYMDGYGRNYQTVVKQASPSKSDFVASKLFDEFGRNAISYLPFVAQSGNTNDGGFKSNPFYQDSIFYKSNFPNEQINYSTVQYDGTPFNLPTKVLAPGNSWGGAGIGISYTRRTNSVSDSVRLWTISISTEDDVPNTSSIYSAGTLSVQQITDERGIKSVSYVDELGRIVLSKTQLASSPTTGHAGWLCTYYVYDEMNHIRAVIPPKAVELLNNATANWSLSNNPTVNSNLCYSYWYGALGQMLMKRVPGKGKMYAAYDLQSRLVMTQDANLRATNQWAFLKYDGQNRLAQSGLITMSGMSPLQVQTAAAAANNYPSLTGTYTITGETYYDDYSYYISGVTHDGNLYTANINSTNFTTNYNTSPEYAQPITQSLRIRGAITGTKKLVLGTGIYLYTTNIYNDNGRTIQIKATNYTGGSDITTVQYSFSGRVLRTHLQHGKGGTGNNPAQNHTLLTKYTYDHIGRLLTTTKNIDGTGDKLTVQNSYNELGQLSGKILGSIETQTYNYNIRGWLQGINKDFVLNGGANTSFGELLSYDYGFTNTQVNGNIAGVKWRSAGDGTARAYGYNYDNNNRLLKADFTQQNSGSSSWTSDKMDFSVSGLSYDASGNILAMKQRGVNVNQPTTIDSLTYTYFSNSNQLQKIKDGIADISPWGDFKDTSATVDDYAYDANGNITKDLNKHIHTSGGSDGISYNVLDKPKTITVNGKGTITYVYDANGALLQKYSTDTRTGIKKVITYIAGFVYQKTLPGTGDASTVPDTLQYALHEEGRIRWSFTQATTSGGFVYDYFLEDHQGNVRSIVTDEKRTDDYPAASLEASTLATEKNYYTNLDGGRTDRTTVLGYPTNDTYTNPNNYVQKLNGNATKIGSGILLKVMAGDSITVHASSWYATGNPAPGTPVSPLTDLVTALANSVPGAAGGKMITSQLTSTVLSPSITGFLTSRDATGNGTQPKSYLNIVVLDEQLNPVITSDGKNSYFEQVGTAGGASVKQYNNIVKRPITKSGYVYVYVSNETPNIDVYWDNLKVTQSRGKLAAEEGYYPFGLSMSALASHAGSIANNAYKHNSATELTEDLDVDYYETYLRQYDAQVGRFTGVDVLSEAMFSTSPYHYGANNPISFNDPSGALEDAFPASTPAPTPEIVLVGGGGINLPPIDYGLLSTYGGMDINTGGGGGGGGTSGSGASDVGGGGMDFGWMFSNTGMGVGGAYGDGGSGSGNGTPGGGGGSSQVYNYSTSDKRWGDGSDQNRTPTGSWRAKLNRLSFETIRGSRRATVVARNNFIKAFEKAVDYDGDPELSRQARYLEQSFLHGSGGVQHMGSLPLVTGSIAAHIFNSPNFKEAARKFEGATKKYFTDNGNLDGYNGNDEVDRDKPGYFGPHDDLGLTAVMGGYKAFQVKVTVTDNQLSFTYTIWDVFGSDDGDALDFFTPGVPDLYYLEKYGNDPGCTFNPFIWNVQIPSP